MNIPKPKFIKCDETSLGITWDAIDIPSNLGIKYNIKLQYKEAFENWDEVKERDVTNNDDQDGKGVNGITLKEADLIDLKPGTAYSIRLAIEEINSKESESKSVWHYGAETVFDTKPIDCTPKKKNCIIS
eukprot:gene5814-8020_t